MGTFNGRDKLIVSDICVLSPRRSTLLLLTLTLNIPHRCMNRSQRCELDLRHLLFDPPFLTVGLPSGKVGLYSGPPTENVTCRHLDGRSLMVYRG